MVALSPIAAGRSPAMPICQHLAPLARELVAAGVRVSPGRPCPHDADWGVWFHATVLFDLGRLCRRLSFDPCVTTEEYDGYFATSDVTVYCTCCKQAIVGLHPRTAPPGTPRVG